MNDQCGSSVPSFFLTWVAFPIFGLMLQIWSKALQRRSGGDSRSVVVAGDFAIGLELLATALVIVASFSLQKFVQLYQITCDALVTESIDRITRQLSIQQTLQSVAIVLVAIGIVFAWLSVITPLDPPRNVRTFLRTALLPLLLGIAALFAVPYLFFDGNSCG